MQAFTVHGEVPFFKLLSLDRSTVELSHWDCHHVEVIGPISKAIDTSSVPGDRRSMSGRQLIQLAASVEQMVGGDFSGYTDGDDVPWLTIRSIRGMYFVVITSSESFVTALQENFDDVRESPNDIEFIT